jgi:[ribosomal protein S5]-alanine N-acetyltransferase
LVFLVNFVYHSKETGMINKIETANLEMIPCTKEILEAAIEADNQLAGYLKVIVPDSWTEFGTGPLKYCLEKLRSENEQGWWTYFPIHKKDNTLVGSGGYKGKPVEGMVEIGYEIALAYRNKGLATEFAKALIDHAFSFPDIHTVTAHTLAEVNPSTKVLSKCGFIKVDEINDPDDGLIWKWELKKTPSVSGKR